MDGQLAQLEGVTPAAADTSVEANRAAAQLGVLDWGKALRLKHWTKNLLVFVPLVLSADPAPALVLQTLLLFVLFGMLASATYLINDLVDLTADRAHPEKRHRPLAAGRIGVRDGIVAAVGLLMVTTLAAVLWLRPVAAMVLAGYLVVTIVYSFYIKRRPVADVLCLAGLLTSRILAGSMVSLTGVSPWLISFSLLFFLSLAQVKRYAELQRALGEGADGVPSRGYAAADLPLLLTAGVGSTFAATVIFAVYLIQEEYPRHIYHHPQWLWAMMPILLGWLLRVWRRAVHGRMNEDPVLFALHDRVSLALAGAVGLILVAAWL